MQQTLSPKQLGEAIGVSESSLKRWADDGQLQVTRTAGGHRRIPLTEAIRFVRSAGLPVVKPQILGLTELKGDAGGRHDGGAGMHESLRAALIEGRAADVRAMIVSSYLAGASVAELCDGPLAAAMHHVGKLWQHSRDGIFIEHRASEIVASALHQLRGLLPPPASDAPVAVGGAPDRDIYILPTLMAATTLASAGWREVNLGHNSPLDVLAVAAERWDARLVWIAVSSDRRAEDLVNEVAELGARLAERGRELAIGGRAWPARVKLKAGNVHVMGSMVELEALARGLLAPA